MRSSVAERAAARRLRGPAIPDLVFLALLAVLVVGAAVPLTQSDGDLFAHLRLGHIILETGRLPETGQLGLLSVGVPTVPTAWLSEVAFAAAERLGGWAGVVLLAATMIALAHALVAGLLRRAPIPMAWVLLGVAGSLLLGATHWLARPHLASLLGAIGVLRILEAPVPRRWAGVVPVMILWANAHAGFLFGLALIAAYVVGEGWEAWGHGMDGAARRRVLHRAGWGALATLGTLINPVGLGLHRAVWASLTDPAVATAMDEALAPTFRSAPDLLFLGALLVLLSALGRPRASSMARGAQLVVLGSVAAALLSGRHIALFAVTGWPLAIRALAPRGAGEWAVRLRVEDRRRLGGHWAGVGVVLGVLLFLAVRGSRPALIDPGRLPVAGVQALVTETPAAERETLRLFTTWRWGGYVAWAVPGMRAFVDPLRFTGADVEAYGRILQVQERWEVTLDDWGIEVALVPTAGRLAHALRARPAWRCRRVDATATLCRRVREGPWGAPDERDAAPGTPASTAPASVVSAQGRARMKASTGAIVAAGSSSCGTCPSVGNITTWLPARSRANRAASPGGMSRSRAPQRINVGIRRPRSASVSLRDPNPRKRANSASRFPSRTAIA